MCITINSLGNLNYTTDNIKELYDNSRIDEMYFNGFDGSTVRLFSFLVNQIIFDRHSLNNFKLFTLNPYDFLQANEGILERNKVAYNDFYEKFKVWTKEHLMIYQTSS